MKCNSHLKLNTSSANSLSINLNIEIGEGRSQVVGIDDQVYVTSGTSEDKDGDVLVSTTTQRIDAATGTPIWTYQTSATMHPSQETFRNANATPQATPAIAGSSLIIINFTGQLTCLNRADGKLIWEKELVQDLGASAMKYGFASSPCVDSKDDKQVYVLAGGDSGGLLCLNVADGSVEWKSKFKSASYATPVFAQFGSVQQLVIESEDEVIGISKADGSRLWNYTFPQKGLTNAATPLVVDQSHLVISGNGCNGTRCLSIEQEDDEWRIHEKWFVPNVKFVYTNWAMLADGVAVGCTDKFLAAIDVNDGFILGRWRGFSQIQTYVCYLS